MGIAQVLFTDCPSCSQEYHRRIFDFSKLLREHQSIEKIHLKKISLPIHRQAKQELKIKVAQNLLESTLCQSSSHNNFFLGSNPL